MQTITLHEKDIYKGSLLLVNQENPIYDQNLSYYAIDEDFQDIQLQKIPANLLKDILKQMDTYEEITLVSGYRTSQEQVQIFEDCLQQHGQDFTYRYVALPEHSEHQTGLAIDLGLKTKDIDFIRPDFPYEGIAQNFRSTALQYGFIERYQKEKEEITGISAEPWHFRYVGIPHSLLMHENSWCLEEYIEEIKRYTLFQPYSYCFHNRLFQIFYVPITGESTSIEVCDHSLYQISGNNKDGCIVTVWRSYV